MTLAAARPRVGQARASDLAKRSTMLETALYYNAPRRPAINKLEVFHDGDCGPQLLCDAQINHLEREVQLNSIVELQGHSLVVVDCRNLRNCAEVGLLLLAPVVLIPVTLEATEGVAKGN